MKIESLDHIHIYSEDAERSAAFYREHFDARNFANVFQPGANAYVGTELTY